MRILLTTIGYLWRGIDKIGDWRDRRRYERGMKRNRYGMPR